MAFHHLLSRCSSTRARRNRNGSRARTGAGRLKTLLAVVAGVVILTGCDGILDVDTSGVITPEDLDLAGPSAVPTLVNGMAGSTHRALDAVVRYSALLADEMILGGTFPDRADVDRRRILDTNTVVADELYSPLHVARFQADTTVMILESRLDDPAFEEVLESLNEGIALGRLYGGYTRIWLAELFCWSILTGVTPEGAPLLPDQRMVQALEYLEEAEALAEEGGFEDIRLAAIVGRARALLWLGDHPAAAGLADQVPRGFRFNAEFSRTNFDQYNQMYALSWGDTEPIRWTVGDGSRQERGNEAWEYLGTFLQLNLIRDRPTGFTSFQGSIPVYLQMRYSRPESSIAMASGIEAELIRAEAYVRAGETPQAESLLNGMRADFSARAALLWNVTPPAPGSGLAPVTLSGELEDDLKRVVDERARELWLTGDRQATARRLRLDPSTDIDLFPSVKVGIGGGDDVAFPVVRVELDGNPVLGPGEACPAGQVAGGWR
jgi:starch-binding outer membrane protein, SusD/RagB family